MLDADEEVAIKFLNPTGVLEYEAQREKFKQEVKLMRLCRHINVVSCLGSWVDKVSNSSML